MSEGQKLPIRRPRYLIIKCSVAEILQDVIFDKYNFLCNMILSVSRYKENNPPSEVLWSISLSTVSRKPASVNLRNAVRRSVRSPDMFQGWKYRLVLLLCFSQPISSRAGSAMSCLLAFMVWTPLVIPSRIRSKKTIYAAQSPRYCIGTSQAIADSSKFRPVRLILMNVTQ